MHARAWTLEMWVGVVHAVFAAPNVHESHILVQLLDDAEDPRARAQPLDEHARALGYQHV
jgi:hypothetical protein